MKLTKLSSNGFSLIEMVVAVAIAALLAGVALPSFINWKRSQVLGGAATNLMADLETAKRRAVRENSFVAVLFSNNQYTVFVDNGAGGGVAGDWTRNGTEALVQVRTLPAGVKFNIGDLTLADQRVRFNGRGLPMDTGASETMPLENVAGRRNVSLTRLGHVRIE